MRRDVDKDNVVKLHDDGLSFRENCHQRIKDNATPDELMMVALFMKEVM